MENIKSVIKAEKDKPEMCRVTFDDDTSISLKDFEEISNLYFSRYIAGFTTVPEHFINYFSRSTDSKGLENLVRNSKREGYLEAVQSQFWAKHRKAIAVGTILALAFGAVIILIMLKQQGLLPF